MRQFKQGHFAKLLARIVPGDDVMAVLAGGVALLGGEGS